MKHVSGWFETREAADLATEHLVQEYGFQRTDIFVQPVGGENSAGFAVSGGDAATPRPGNERRTDGAVNEEAIEVSVDVEDSDVQRVRDALSQAGAIKLDGQ